MPRRGIADRAPAFLVVLAAAAHGRREMPTWGRTLGDDPERLRRLVLYRWAIQR
jgi:hypothetical protein